MNPARALAPAIWYSLAMKNVWVYFVGPPIGAVIAGLLFQILFVRIRNYNFVGDLLPPESQSTKFELMN